MALSPIHRGDSGDAVKHLQAGVNKTLAGHDFDWRKIKVDGEAGPNTFKAAHFAGWLQGLSRAQLRNIGKGTLTVHAQEILRHEKKRSEAQQKAEAKRAPHAANIRKHHRNSQLPGDGLGTFDGVTVAGWIVPWLERSRKAGWSGTVVSGYRTPEYSESLCYAMCGAPSCPGKCAGRSSNHSGKDYPAGAVDVSDYSHFAQIQPQINSPLKNALGAADPVHFSYSGH